MNKQETIIHGSFIRGFQIIKVRKFGVRFCESIYQGFGNDKVKEGINNIVEMLKTENKKEDL